MQYRPEIDGLRAIAVLPVIFFHAGFGLFNGGFVGVDIFFVISGFLITNIIIKEKEAGVFNLSGFYERRARRILPALFFIILITMAFGWFWMRPEQNQELSKSIIAVIFFTSNFFFWQNSGYFSPSADEIPLLHTWSLAVEEQYYIFYPLFLLIFWKIGKEKLIILIVICLIASLAFSQYGSSHFNSASFYLMPSRAWELLSGSIIAFLIHTNPHIHKNNNLFASTGLLMVLASLFVFDKNTPWPSISTLLPVAGTLLVIVYAGNKTVAHKILSYPLLVFIGLISYSAYLWHVPIFSFTRIYAINEPSKTIMIVLSITSIILAVLTWKFIEKPFRRKGDRAISLKTLIRSTLFILVFTTVLGVYGITSKGYLKQWLKRNPDIQKTYKIIHETPGNNQKNVNHCIFRIENILPLNSKMFDKCKKKYSTVPHP